MKQIIIIAIITGIFVTIDVNSQANFKNGYVVNNSLDTIRGYINVRSNFQNSKSCEFKKSLESETIIYYPNEIQEYKPSNERSYISKKIIIDNVEKEVFLEFLVSGIVNLYYIKELINDYYFIEKNDTIYQLSNNEVEIIKDGTKYEKDSKEYLRILSFLFQESSQARNMIASTQFNHKSLINITKDYHNSVCEDYSCIDYTKSSNNNLFIEPVVGFIVSQMRLKTSTNHSENLRMNVGANIRFNQFIKNPYASFSVGLHYSSNKFDHEYYNTIITEFKKPHRIYAEYSILRLPLIITYTFPKSQYQPFINFGFNNIFIFDLDYNVERIFYNDLTGVKLPSSDVISDFRIYQYGFTAGAGLKFTLDNKSYFYFSGNYEYRTPFAVTYDLTNYQYIHSIIFNVAYGFPIRN